MSDLSVRIGPLVIANPVMTASGCCQYGLELSSFFPLPTIGAVVVKGLSLEPRSGNPVPRIAETPSGMLNSIGLQNIGIDSFLDGPFRELKELGATVAANLFGTRVEEYERLAAKCGEVGVEAVELNLSCPNVSEGGMEFGVDPAQVKSITALCRSVYAGSLWVKLTPNVTNISIMARAAEDGGADAVTCINTLRGMAIDVNSFKPRLRKGIGGLSGPAIRPVAVRCVFEASRAVRIPVIGCGGIAGIEDVIEFLLAGASAVQVGTILFRDPALPAKLTARLDAWLEDRGIASSAEIVGKVAIDD